MKKFISILAAIAILATSAAVFADEVILDGTLDIIQGDIMAISEVEEAVYNKQVIEGTYKTMEEGQLLIETADGEYVINVDENTIYVDETATPVTAITEGSKVRIVADMATTRSLPPQSYGYVVMTSDAEAPAFPFYAEIANISEDEDGKFFETADGQYIVRITEETAVAGLKVKSIIKAEDLTVGTSLLFSTDIMTLSLPAQCSAKSIAVIELADAPIDVEVAQEVLSSLDKVVVNGQEIAVKVIMDGEVALLPVRAISEAMGLQVAWDETLFAVTVGTTPMGANFRIGENSYNKARMAAQQLSAAPQLINDLTYVPVEFFTDIIEAQTEILDGTLNVSFIVE